MWNIWLIFEQFAWWVTQTSFFKRVPSKYKVCTHGIEFWDQKCASTLVKYFQSKVHSSGWKIDKKNTTQLGIALKTFWTLCNEISVAIGRIRIHSYMTQFRRFELISKRITKIDNGTTWIPWDYCPLEWIWLMYRKVIRYVMSAMKIGQNYAQRCITID